MGSARERCKDLDLTFSVGKTWRESFKSRKVFKLSLLSTDAVNRIRL